MNTEGCPEGSFTDEIFLFPGASPACSSSIALWLSLSIVLVAIRVGLSIDMYLQKDRRPQDNYHEEVAVSKSKAKPSSIRRGFQISQLMVSFFQVLFVVLASFNIIHSSNGASFFLTGLSFAPQALGHTLQARSVVRLGRRFIPLSLKKYTLDENLAREDLLLRIAFFLSLGSISISFIFFLLCVCLPASAGLFFQIAFCLTAVYECMHGLAIAWQFQRCILAVRRMQQQSGNLNIMVSPGGGSKSMSSSMDPKIKRALQYMHRIQTIVISIAVSGAILSILFATFIIPVTFWVYCIAFFLMDDLLMGGIAISRKLKSRKTQQQHQGDTTSSDRVASMRFSSRKPENSNL